ncbi:MAG: hypothetical protein EZS28_019180 [Streblomastix strix]|uniref:Uncharacterized protein n=2 Tax=Streblomastix strix TaxID=222440 RepID=A0A5J4VSI8_9EUKA|nr:MAG: hypothetical protein EZS28_019180 [Streblomastix strix]
MYLLYGSYHRIAKPKQESSHPKINNKAARVAVVLFESERSFSNVCCGTRRRIAIITRNLADEFFTSNNCDKAL